ncbi:hypothetical protein THRCLA_01239 [Thraustotheca clavata]|uniref:FYVE-type domain-containing protein n=1 Tax=Thraustotheca clavata TaxID=74557 RepID=A0A1W0A8W5_9STRA|nr:hypothetical protein THRCLA_01239 [Thraustotheca clavata]
MAYQQHTGIFKIPQLTSEQEQEYLHLGEDSFQSLLERVLNTPNIPWQAEDQYDGVSIFEEKHEPHHLSYRMISKINATIEELARIHDFSSPANCKCYVSEYATDIINMETLHSFIERTKERPFRQAYLKWNAIRSPVPMIFCHRDFVYVETQDEFELNSGLRGWAFAQRSIKAPFAPKLYDFGYARGELLDTGCVYLETEIPGVLDVIYCLRINFNGSMPSWARRIGLRARARGLDLMNDRVHRLRLCSQHLRSPESCDCKTTTNSCFICQKLQHFKHKHCQSCGKVVCAGCSRTWKLHGTEDTEENLQFVCVCIACSLAIRGRTTSDPDRVTQRSSSAHLIPTMKEVLVERPNSFEMMNTITTAELATLQESNELNDEPSLGLDLSYVEVYRSRRR